MQKHSAFQLRVCWKKKKKKACSSFIPYFPPLTKGLMTSQLLVTSQMLDHMSETFAGWPAQQQLRPLEAKRAARFPRGQEGEPGSCQSAGSVGEHSWGFVYVDNQRSCHQLDKTFNIYACLWILYETQFLFLKRREIKAAQTCLFSDTTEIVQGYYSAELQ